ncbi:mitochondrial carrier domain-containing protein [Penicillium taxi]|uniref:mitochondrial carrier domain-containing protein n=1 Tax=Penicillium taxi TaxID=168475 RepID=UPI00254515A9|nr:mitochondrial carrier domain-containing protein [Penicillium taxi]KAJ5889088.1 mitochondrial carrier domain-containing protein [Penicillium taxi]
MTGASAGATEAFVVVPFELVKIRLQNQSSVKQYRGVLDCTIQVGRESGLFGLYRGFKRTVWRHIVWDAGYFGCIFKVGSLLPQVTTKESELLNQFIAGSVGGTFGAALNTPLDVVKSRIKIPGLV